MPVIVTDDNVQVRDATRVPRRTRRGDGRKLLILPLVTLLAITLWSYWPTVLDLLHEWQGNDNYSAGQIVPLVAVFLIWRERRAGWRARFTPCWPSGMALVVLAQVAHVYGLLFLRQAAERYALVLTILGLTLLIAGRQVFRRLFWILLFLFLMVPLPGVAHNLIAGPLQRLATTGSVVLLEAVGVSVGQQGNVVLLNERTPIAVAEACSGLRMLTAFVIVAAFIAYMVKRPRWQKAILLASSIPVAVVCNIVRIFVTALLMLHVSNEVGEKFFHDCAGLVMMPAAVLLLFGELWLMDKLITPESAARPGRADICVRSARRPARRASE